MTTKPVKIKDLNPAQAQKPYGVYSRYEEYLNLLMNGVRITKSNEEPLNYDVETFIKRTLFEAGAVGYDKATDKWFYVYGEGKNELGNPTILTLVTANGRMFRKEASYDDKVDGAYKVSALPVNMDMGGLIKETTDFMQCCDLAMRQNVDACKTPYIVVCKNEDLKLSFQKAIQQKQDGQAVVVVSEELGEGLKAVNIGVEYLANSFAETRDRERDILLNKLGIVTGNDDKKERVQSAEVNATITQASDYVYMLIDTFNKQMITYGIDAKMAFNGSMEEIYLDGEGDKSKEKADVNNVEKEGSVND